MCLGLRQRLPQVAGCAARTRTHGKLPGFIRKQDHANLWQAPAARGRAYDDLPVAPFEQRLYADGWFHQRAVDLHEIFQDAACGAGSGISEPVD